MTIRIYIVCLIILALIVPATLVAQPFQEEIFYQIFPISFSDSDGDSLGDFNGISEAIPYMQNLGVTAVWLNPVFVTKTYHGYQYARNDSLNPKFGTEAEFSQMVEALHDAGIKIFIDLVGYGVAEEHPFFQDAHGNPSSPYDQWFAFTDEGNLDYFGFGGGYDDWEGNRITHVFWNHNHQPVREHLVEKLSHWLDPNEDGGFHDGVDGFRIDHLSVNHYEEAAWGYDLPLWEDITSALRSVNSGVRFIAEDSDSWIHHPEMFDYGIDAAFNLPSLWLFPFTVYYEWGSYLSQEMNMDYNLILEHGQWLGLLNNHDYDRVRTIFEYHLGYNAEQAKELCKLAAVWLFTSPFPPVIYAGEEIGMRGLKVGWYGNDANDLHLREPFEWCAELTTPPHAYWYGGHPEYADSQFIQDNDGVSVQEQDLDDTSLLNHYRKLIALRKKHSPLNRGKYSSVEAGDSTVCAFLRHDDSSSVFVAMNLSSEQRNLTLDLTTVLGSIERTVTDIWDTLSYPNITVENASHYPLTIGPQTFVILGVSGRALAPPFVMGGSLDEGAISLGSSEDLHLWYAVKDSFLYVASTPAFNDTTDTTDIFIMISSDLTYMRNAPWAKAGWVADWGLFLANEGDHEFAGWFDQQESWLSAWYNFLACENVLEGYVPFSEIPGYHGIVYIALAEYQTNSGDSLINQLPLGDGDENIDFNEYYRIEIEPMSVEHKGKDCLTPRAYLSQNYPNPFNPITTIRFGLPRTSNVDIRVYNICGQLVETLVSEQKIAGLHTVVWDASDKSSGIYFYQIVAGDYRETRKCVLLK